MQPRRTTMGFSRFAVAAAVSVVVVIYTDAVGGVVVGR